jgi:thiamine kinase-like enzyme
MLPPELESVAARHVPGEGTLDIHRLNDGLVNETYRVLRNGNAYVLRVAAANPYDLGLDRAWEARVLEHAVLGGLAPVLEYSDPRRGILISRWVEGSSWGPADVRRQSNISRVAALVQRIHALPMPSPARVMNPKKWIDYYSAALPNAAADLRSAAAMRLAALSALPNVDPVLCHSDLHTQNLIDNGHSLVLLDWEYAHAADPLWDLAGWVANNDLEDDLTQALLASYVGRTPTRREYMRLQLLGWLYDYVCLLWSELYLTLHSGRRRGAATPGVDAPGVDAPGLTPLDGISARVQLLAARLSSSK